MNYRYSGFAFNRAGLNGLDKAAAQGVNRLLLQRERELNTIETSAYVCAGGPWHGQVIELATVDSYLPCSAPLAFGQWSGQYRVIASDSPGYFAAVWFGNEEPDFAAIQFYATPDGDKPAKAAPVKGFAVLTDALLADPEICMMPEIVRNYDSAVGYGYGRDRIECAVFTIGRCRLRCRNTPEAIERLKAKIVKGKKWFSDKVLP